jgi:nicotinate-nucleotide adenylyltransferase
VLARLPPAARGLRIGLYGGSFDPAHAGHRHVSRMALARLRLDRLWWLVTPGNPLKDGRGRAPLPQRVAAAQAVAAHPRITVTGFEAEIASVYTLQTIRYLRARLPAARFVWIMGADSLASFHRWRGFRQIAELVPIAVIDRPGHTLTATGSPAGRALGPWRLDEHDAPILADCAPPAWVYLHGPRSSLSSTALRAARRAPY